MFFINLRLNFGIELAQIWMAESIDILNIFKMSMAASEWSAADID